MPVEVVGVATVLDEDAWRWQGGVDAGVRGPTDRRVFVRGGMWG